MRNLLEITVEERPLPLEMCPDSQDDRPQTRLKNGSFSPQNAPPCGTTAWYICHHLIAQSPWKNNGPHCKRPLDTPPIVLSFQDDCPENNPKTANLDTQSTIEQARRLETAQHLFAVMRLCSPVVLSYLDARFEPRCGRCGPKDFLLACCCLLLLLLAKMLLLLLGP